jgi:1-deoxy-D-xylulose-5-phosphate synthase
MAPKDENELQHMIKTAVHHQANPTAIRYPRGEVVGVKMDKEPAVLPIGKAEVMSVDKESPDVVFIAIGYSVQTALEAQALVRKEGFSTALINARFAKPLDETTLIKMIESSQVVVTVEENTVMGGFGSAVLELMAKKGVSRPVELIGIPDRFIDHASPKIQRELTEIDGPSIARKTVDLLRRTLKPAKPSKGRKKVSLTPGEVPSLEISTLQ